MTSDALRGVIPGVDAHARAVALAGALAELGVTRLALIDHASGWRELSARETDLPREITGVMSRSGGELVALSHELRVTLPAGEGPIEWHTTDAAAARTLASLRPDAGR